MEVKSYRANSLHEALQLVRKDMGPDAAVLETRKVAPSWWRGLLGHRVVEVTASSELKVATRFAEVPSRVHDPRKHPRHLTHRQQPVEGVRPICGRLYLTARDKSR